MPEEIKKYRYDLLEDFRKKTIEQIKEQRNLLINKNEEKNKEKNETKNEENKEVKKIPKNINQPEKKYISKTFSMENMISLEEKNIEKIKKKQKQKIEFLIEKQMKAELMNLKNIEKDRK